MPWSVTPLDKTEASYLDGREQARLQYLEVVGQPMPKLYFNDPILPIILVYWCVRLCQLQQKDDDTTVELPIRCLSGTFDLIRWSTIEKEAFAIYWASKKLDDFVCVCVGGVRFTIRTDHRSLLYLNSHGSRNALRKWKLDNQHYDAALSNMSWES